MKEQILNGIWECFSPVTGGGRKQYRCKAAVPGSVHQALLENKLILDPYFRDNEQSLFWIGEQDWVFEREFVPEKDLIDASTVNLVFFRFRYPL